MDTRILDAERLAAIPGCISSAELFSQAVKTGKKVKYYVLQRQSHRIMIRYVTPNGSITNGKGGTFPNFAAGIPRFTNYWFAYAYKCKVDKQREK
jgi:hypothetical protein